MNQSSYRLYIFTCYTCFSLADNLCSLFYSARTLCLCLGLCLRQYLCLCLCLCLYLCLCLCLCFCLCFLSRVSASVSVSVSVSYVSVSVFLCPSSSSSPSSSCIFPRVPAYVCDTTCAPVCVIFVFHVFCCMCLCRFALSSNAFSVDILGSCDRGAG